jgi:ApaG protein
MVKEVSRESEGPWRSGATYSQTTRELTVTVEPTFLEEQSSPAENQFVWAYRVRIENHGSQTVQLLRRHWRITDALGRVHEVKGPGVVGEQPVLRPGDSYEYTSGTPLSTPSGIMSGSYQMESDEGEHFDIIIPAFSLDSPHQPRRIN